jgi:hypothetical protein
MKTKLGEYVFWKMRRSTGSPEMVKYIAANVAGGVAATGQPARTGQAGTGPVMEI